MWSWDLQVETCAVCRNHIMERCLECQASNAPREDCAIAWGKCNQFQSPSYPLISLILSYFSISIDCSAFHKHCVAKWLQKHPVCPLCNQEWEYAKIQT